MKFRLFALLFLLVVGLAIGALSIRARQPDAWKVNAVTFILAADGSRIVALNGETAFQTLRVWNVAEHRAMPVQHPTDKEHVFTKLLAVSPHGEWASLNSRDSQITPTSEWLEVWDLRRAPVRRAWRVRCTPAMQTATWVNERLVTLQNSAVKCYDERGKLVSNRQSVGHLSREVFIPSALSRDGSVVIDGMNLLLYNARTGQHLRVLEKPRPDANWDSNIEQLSFSADGQFLTAEDNFKKVMTKRLWNVKTGRLIRPKKPLSGSWTAQGHGLVQPDGNVEDVVTGQKIATIALPANGAAMEDVQTSVDGRVVVQGVGSTLLIQSPRRF